MSGSKKVIVIFILLAVAASVASSVAGSATMIQIIINGIFAGSIYGLLAVGLSLIFGVMKIINICHGEFVILGAYASFWLYRILGLSPFISMFLAFSLLFIVGLLISNGLLRRVLKFGPDPPLIVAFGLSLCLQNLMRIFWSATPRGIIISYGILAVYGVSLPIMNILITTATVFLLVLLWWFLTKTYMGMAIRAVAMGAEVASLMGINPDRINTFSYALGSALAALTGTLVALVFSFDPSTGSMFTNRAFAAIVLGGVGYIPGAFAGGVTLGVTEGLASFFFGDAIRDGVAYTLFLIVLILRPSGFFAKYRAF